MFFVSTGRCGTTRIAEILRLNLPQNFTVLHQTRYSRRANVAGNFSYHFSIGKAYTNRLFNRIVRKNVPAGNILISTDPLISMIIPDEVVRSPNTVIIHVMRDASEFALSMYNFTKKKKKSFIAHNLIPFWQPHLWPFENILNKSIIDKYELIHMQKNKFFTKKYKKNLNYQCVTMNNLLSPHTLAQLLKDNFQGLEISIPESELRKKTNQSVQ